MLVESFALVFHKERYCLCFHSNDLELLLIVELFIQRITWFYVDIIISISHFVEGHGCYTFMYIIPVPPARWSLVALLAH